MNAQPSIPQCVPPLEFIDLPFHWLQWRTPLRHEAPRPWAWDQPNRQWCSSSSQMSPERAAAMQWHYVQPARVPMTATGDEQIVVQLGTLLNVQYFAHRFQKPSDDPLVRMAALQNLQNGLIHAQTLIDGLDELGLCIVRK